MIMLVIGCMLVILLCSVRADERSTGYLFYTSDVINLDLNRTSYTVGCTVNSTGSEGVAATIQNLMILDSRRKPYSTEIINDTTIIHIVDLQNSNESTVCGVKNYICRLNRSLIGMRTIYVARPPPVIGPADFKCISYNRKRLVCQFRRQNSCGLFTDYSLSMIRLNSHSSCNLTDNGTTLSFDSNSDTCVFSSGHRSLSFRIEGRNRIGTTESKHFVDHFDIVKPEQPNNLQVSELDVTSVNITWNMSFLLLNLNRSFKVEFHLTTKYGVSNRSMIMDLSKNRQMHYQFNDLYAYTKYDLKVRVQVIPNSVRSFEDEYWSEWSSLTFHTKPQRPYHAPRILPGAYSFKERRGNEETIEVYWEQVAEHLHNGPGFGYGIYAVSPSGHTITVNCSNNGVATIPKAKIDEHYTIYLYSYNDEGRSEDTSTIQVFPQKSSYQPKIKRIVYNENYHLQWYPVEDTENLTNYTIMYCAYSTTGSCHGSIQFDTLPANATSYFLNETKPLTIALGANYRWHSSELSWPLCTVSHTTGISQIAFKITDITEHSVTLRMQLSCMDQSLVERFEVRYWSKADHSAVQIRTFPTYDTVILVSGLSRDTEYEVIVTAYDELNNAYEAKSSVRTKNKDILMQLILFLLFGILVMGFVTSTATRRVKKMMNIKVEIPIGLLGIDEIPVQTKCLREERDLTPEQFDDVMELEELSLADDKPYEPMKSILKKTEQSFPSEPQSFNNSEKPKLAVQIVTENDYIKPSQMSGMSSLVSSIKGLDQNHSLGSSSGYVDVNLMMKQYQEVG